MSGIQRSQLFKSVMFLSSQFPGSQMWLSRLPSGTSSLCQGNAQWFNLGLPDDGDAGLLKNREFRCQFIAGLYAELDAK